MQRFKVLAVLLLVFGLAVPAWASGPLVDNSTNATAAAAAAASATGGSVGNVTADGGTHIQTVTPIQNNTQLTDQHQLQLQGQDQKLVNKPTMTTTVDVKTDVPRQAPPAVAPGLSVSSLSCYGTWGVGASSPFGGVSAGFPTLEKGCAAARVSLTLQALGEREAALIYYANSDPDIRSAMEKAGRLPKAADAPVVESKPVASLIEPTTHAALAPELKPSTDIPSAMAATQARRVEAVQGN